MQDKSLARVYVALGSNLGERSQHINAAFDEMASLSGVSDLHRSSLYETEPMGPQDQPDYLNAVCGFDYRGLARSLMQQLQSIERLHGRQAGGQRWGARPLDLDILLFGDERMNEPDLIIPHPGLSERSFVLWPLAELAPSLLVPGKGTIQVLQRHCQQFGIKRHES